MTFPPAITPWDLLKYKRIPNIFMIYRIALRKELRSKNITISRKDVSVLASSLWKKEPDFVKEKYKEIEIEAKKLKKLRKQYTMSLQQGNPSAVEQQISFENLMNSFDIVNSTIPISNSPDIVQLNSLDAVQLNSSHNAQDINLTNPISNSLNSFDQIVPNAFCQVSNENFSAYPPYSQQESSSFTFDIEQRVRNLEQQFQILNNHNRYDTDTFTVGMNIETRVQILEQERDLFIQTLINLNSSLGN
ncbi:hypothetical protein RclHR1_00600013 [Rhizophagus clarus]|uniref:Kinase-like domain-containing protein n=1 Tax=Rhizophagus clarus TaxID=94130 RepID=A0A2Z6S730_9GLOM|nr:hypothetical protein RclHR1_00600013 [Rhizophagus clarus]GES78833.1 kinase-like domain-containing protein [Rhizophagus clarus]